MTVTPYLIADYLVPWALAAMACTLLFLSVRCLVVTGSRVAAALRTGQPPCTRRNQRPFTGGDVSWAVLLAVASVILAEVIDDVGPGMGSPWWSQPLVSGWEVSYGFATILMVVAEHLMLFAAALLTVLIVQALMWWLAEPVDAEPGSPNRVQWLRGAAVASWNSYRRARRRARARSLAAPATGERG